MFDFLKGAVSTFPRIVYTNLGTHKFNSLVKPLNDILLALNPSENTMRKMGEAAQVSVINA